MQNYLKKIKEYGIIKSAKMAPGIFWCKINTVLCLFYRAFPIHSNLIVLESEGDFTDNSQALYEYMRRNDYLKKYNVIWLAEDPKGLMKISSVKAVSIKKTRLNFPLDYYLSVCKYFIYDHRNILSKYKRKEQVIFNLWHGAPFKAGKGAGNRSPKTNNNIFLSTGEYCTKTLAIFLDAYETQAVELGYPRIDYFFDDLTDIRAKFENRYKFSWYKKVILWMPTFRQCNATCISEDYIHNETGLPIFETKNQLLEFNEFLYEKNIFFVLKIHPLQADLQIFQTSYTNILILRNEDLQEMRIQLYQFIPLADALISDYSSVSIDYMVLDKPMIYTLDDYEDYKNSRGFIVDNVLDYMPGYHVYNMEEMKRAISEIADGKDVYKEQRHKILPVMHKYPNGGASKRILDYLEIKK